MNKTIIIVLFFMVFIAILVGFVVLLYRWSRKIKKNIGIPQKLTSSDSDRMAYSEEASLIFSNLLKTNGYQFEIDNSNVVYLLSNRKISVKIERHNRKPWINTRYIGKGVLNPSTFTHFTFSCNTDVTCIWTNDSLFFSSYAQRVLKLKPYDHIKIQNPNHFKILSIFGNNQKLVGINEKELIDQLSNLSNLLNYSRFFVRLENRFVTLSIERNIGSNISKDSLTKVVGKAMKKDILEPIILLDEIHKCINLFPKDQKSNFQS